MLVVTSTTNCCTEIHSAHLGGHTSNRIKDEVKGSVFVDFCKVLFPVVHCLIRSELLQANQMCKSESAAICNAACLAHAASVQKMHVYPDSNSSAARQTQQQ